MKISIVTPSFNSSRTIEDTICSVANQSYREIEHIIIDGGSSDGTLDIVRKYRNQISKVVSERDRGLYDAMNKGLILATGEVVGILNSDDFYADQDVLRDVMSQFKNPVVDAVYGDLVYVAEKDTRNIVRYWQAGEYREKNLDIGWMPPHPTLFVRKKVYDRVGAYRLDLSISADYELILRALKVHRIKLDYVPRVLTMMRAGGKSSKNVRNRIRAFRENLLAWKLNDIPVPATFYLRQVLKIKQYLDARIRTSSLAIDMPPFAGRRNEEISSGWSTPLF